MIREQTNLMEEQLTLRRERAQKENFLIKNVGKETVYSEFNVVNPATGGDYRVAVRGFSPGDNYCSCPDFRKNTIGSCKHIEAVLMHLSKTVSKRRLAGVFVPRITEIYLHYARELSVRITYSEDSDSKLKKLAGRYFTPEGILRENKLEQFPAFMRSVEGLEDRIVIYRDVLDYVEKELDHKQGEREERKYREQLEKGTFGKGLLKTKLYRYQKEGIIFAACRRRCILGDDMGLGKTIQAIGATQLLIRTKGIEKHLVICPASLKYQWKREIEKFTQHLPTVVEGNIATRRWLYRSDFRGFAITTYESARMDVGEIMDWAPELIILDEAQRIKNWETKTAQRIKELKSPYALVLTGTPMENRIDELFSIVEYVDDRRLGPAFKFLSDHTVYDPECKSRITGYKDLDVIRDKLSPILLRRSKNEVLKQLPARTDNNFFVPMTPEQYAPYSEQQDIVARIVARWKRYGFLSELDHRRLMCALANMRMICDSTFLYDKESNVSPKLEELKSIIRELSEQNRKVVIFSQWTRMLDKVAEVVAKEGLQYVYLHGGVPSARRGEIIRRFWDEDDVRVFLSSDAGGVGLNLQTGSAVINVDIPWNPAVLEQRIGRVHRMGQERNVQVVNLVTRDSIEERILDILGNKKSLFEGVFEGTCDAVDFKTSSRSVFRELVDEMAGADTPIMPETATEIATADPEMHTGPGEMPGPSASGGLTADFEPFFRIGKDILVALTAAMSGAPPDTSRSSARIVTDPATGTRNLNITLPPDDVLKNSLKSLGHFLINLGD